MLATAATLILFALILTLVVDVIRRDGGKIIAALEGRSWTAGPTQGRPVTLRFNSRRTEAVPEPLWRPAMRAAA